MSLPVYTPPPREPVTWRGRRERFARWRGTRPFWGGVWTIVAGIYLWGLTAAPIGVVVIQGVAGVSAIVICLVYVLLTLVAWSQPQLRVVTGGIVIVLALAAILLTNLGGFIVGTLMGLHGGASMIAWKPFVRRWTRPTPPDGVSRPGDGARRPDGRRDAGRGGRHPRRPFRHGFRHGLRQHAGRRPHRPGRADDAPRADHGPGTGRPAGPAEPADPAPRDRDDARHDGAAVDPAVPAGPEAATARSFLAGPRSSVVR